MKIFHISIQSVFYLWCEDYLHISIAIPGLIIFTACRNTWGSPPISMQNALQFGDWCTWLTKRPRWPKIRRYQTFTILLSKFVPETCYVIIYFSILAFGPTNLQLQWNKAYLMCSFRLHLIHWNRSLASQRNGWKTLL